MEILRFVGSIAALRPKIAMESPTRITVLDTPIINIKKCVNT